MQSSTVCWRASDNMHLPVDFAVVSEHVFGRVSLNQSRKTLFLAEQSGRHASQSYAQKVMTPVQTRAFPGPFPEKAGFSESFRFSKTGTRNSTQHYSVELARLKVTGAFRHSVYTVLQLRYKKWSLLRKTVVLPLSLVFFGTENFCLALELLAELGVKAKSDAKALLRRVGVLKVRRTHRAFWSAKAQKAELLRKGLLQNSETFALNASFFADSKTRDSLLGSVRICPSLPSGVLFSRSLSKARPPPRK